MSGNFKNMTRDDSDLKDGSNSCLKFIAYLQIIGIILVVLGHSFHEYPDGQLGHTMLLYRMMYSFRMPVFMFTSGFLMAYTAFIRSGSNSLSVSRFTVKKVKRLLIPFVTLSLITFIPRSLMSGMADDPIEMSFDSLWQMFFYSHSMVIPYFWFIQSSFTLLILNYALLRLTEKYCSYRTTQLILVMIFAVLSFLPIEWTSFFSFSETIRLGIYFVLGGLYAISSGRVDRYIVWHSPFFLLAVSVVWAVLFFLCEDTPFIIFCSIAGILMCISVAKILKYRKWDMLDHLIGANYMIFLLSWYCNILSQQILAHYVSFPWWIYTALSLISGIYIPWSGYRYIQNHPQSKFVRISAFLLGQRIKNKK